MRRTPIELAAIATAAVPGLTPTAVCSAPDDPADFDSALLVDSEGKRWRVRSPRHAEASARLETEFLVLRAFAPAIRAELPFLMPTVAGTVRQGPLSTFVYAHLAGATRSVEELSGGSAARAKEIGASLAAIHDLPPHLVSNADLPSYTPNEFRQRRLNELDQAATTGKIPPLLLRRWEHALEDVTLWRFNPCVVHGDLHEDNILLDGDRVTAVTGWTDLRIGDPADDMAWLVASNDQDFVDAVLAHYTSSRRDLPDSHLLRRAALSAEFALAQYMVKGLAAANQDMIDEADSMLTALAEDVAEYGGQPISVEPLPRPAPAPDADAEEAPDAGPAVPAVGKVTLIPLEPISEEPDPSDEESADEVAADGKAGPAAPSLGKVTVLPLKQESGDQDSGDQGQPADDQAGDDAAAEDPETADEAGDETEADADNKTGAEAEADDKTGAAGPDTATAAISVVEAKTR